MTKAHFPDTEVEVDICTRDGGLWLDKGELQQIAGSQSSAKTLEHVREFFSDLFVQEHNTEET